MILNGGLGFSPPFFIEGPNTLLSFSIVQSYVLFWALVQYCDFLDLNNCLKYLRPFQTSKQLPKNSVFTSFDRSRGIEYRSKALFNQSNRNWTAIDSSSDSKIIFFIISISRTEVSTNRKSWNLNFHKENSRTRISTLFILQILNTLQLYIIIITYPCTYLCIYNILCLGLNNLIGLFICYFIGSKKKKILKVFILVWYGIFLAHQLGTNTGNGIRFHNGCPLYCMSHFMVCVYKQIRATTFIQVNQNIVFTFLCR